MQYGIDQISIYVPAYYLAMTTLAQARGQKSDHFQRTLGQDKMAILPPQEDVVTMAAHAADQIITPDDKTDIDLVIFATESGIDQSKAAGIYLHTLLGLEARCRCIELKQACYSSTMAVRMALQHVKAHPHSKALVVASDVARYGLETAGEATQGAGAVAMLIAANPRVMSIHDQAGFLTKDVMDFWRPNDRDEALVDGVYSTRLYLATMTETYHDFVQQQQVDFKRYCFHLPFASIGGKAVRKLNHAYGLNITDGDYQHSLYYSVESGNCYTGSLYMALSSLLDRDPADLSSQNIGLFAYGSGLVAEYFSGTVMPEYQQYLHTLTHHDLLSHRVALDMSQYEAFYRAHGHKPTMPTVDISVPRQQRYYYHGCDDMQRRIYTTQQNQSKEIYDEYTSHRAANSCG